MMIKRLLKQTALLVPMLAISVNAFAFTWNDPDDQFTGPYVGAEIGANATGINQNSTAPAAPFPTQPNANGTFTLNATGVEGGLFAGYGHRLPYHLYLGGEFYGMLNSAKATSNYTPNPGVTTPVSVSEKMEGSYGLSIDPGVFLTPNTLLYATMGPTFAVFNSNPPTGDGGLQGSSSSFTKNIVGGRFGLGIETAIAKNLNIRGEYDYSFFPGFTQSSFSQNFATVNTKYKFYSNEALLSLVYHI